MADIAVAQNTTPNVRLQLAARHFYKVSRRLQFAGGSVNVVLALASPAILLFEPGWGPAIGAIAGAWLFISRQLLSPFKRTFQTRGATAQELFDCAVLGLEWNDALVRHISAEEISGATRKLTNLDELKNWYPAGGSSEVWSASVLICQRANAVWARRQHRSYAYVLRSAAIVWAVVGIVVAIAHGASLSDYLITIALPSLPALLDASELADGHISAATSRETLEETADALLRSGGASQQDLREMQDQLFSLREASPIVPGWFYKMIRSRYEEDMQYAAQSAASDRSGKD